MIVKSDNFGKKYIKFLLKDLPLLMSILKIGLNLQIIFLSLMEL